MAINKKPSFFNQKLSIVHTICNYVTTEFFLEF
jgi:hypothetical protein